MAIGPGTTVGAVRLTVADLERTCEFYERVVGLTTLERSEGGASLGAPSGTPLVELDAEPGAPARPPGTTGLFHLAILVPDREQLGRSLQRIAAARHPLTGASDHLVSESLYLRDPEGNGIEIYRDRPREEWAYDDDGALQMATLPLDLAGVLAEDDGRGDEPPPVVSAGTTIGHVHLNVADLGATEAFYADLLGFEVTVRGYPGALFLAAGGYHHHLGANTWAGEGAPPPRGSLGLAWFEVVVADAAELNSVTQDLAAAAVEAEPVRDGVRLTDPAGNGVLLRGPR